MGNSTCVAVQKSAAVSSLALFSLGHTHTHTPIVVFLKESLPDDNINWDVFCPNFQPQTQMSSNKATVLHKQENL